MSAPRAARGPRPSALWAAAGAARRPALPDRRDGVQAHVLRHGRSATCGRSRGRCCCSACCSPSSRRPSSCRPTSPHYPVLLLLNIVLFGFFQEATTTAVTSVVSQECDRAQDAVPAPRDPALGRAHRAVQPRPEPRRGVRASSSRFGVGPHWTWLLLPVLVAAAVRVHHRGVDDRLVAVPALPRRRRSSGRSSSTALFYATPVLYPLEAVSEKLRDVIALNPLAPIFELGAPLDHRPRRAPGRSSSPAGRRALLIPVGIYVATCVFAVWVFKREAPRIAEAL